jgi:predicted short-subunit dehydrogenase-like oxidoreductase (DUF2520 family)
MTHYRISFAGAGKVAEALCLELFKKGHSIRQIISQGSKNGLLLAGKCNAGWSDKLIFSDETDIIIVAVPDKNLKEVLNNIQCGEKTIVAHTAGSFGLELFPANLKSRGVFYPLQTFSKGRTPFFPEIPFFIEASGKAVETVLRSLAESMGCMVYLSDTEHRRLLHVAAVFVSNFTNHMLASGKEISSRAGFEFDVLKPLINETVKKAIELGPEKSQTGPAVRYDANTIEKHMDLLSFSPDLRKIYEEITKSIINRYNSKP